SGKSAKKLRKTKASLRAPRLEEGSCNVIATLRHDQSATDRITPNQATARLEVRPESPCRIIPDRSITFLHANHYDDSELQPFVPHSFGRLHRTQRNTLWTACNLAGSASESQT